MHKELQRKLWGIICTSQNDAAKVSALRRLAEVPADELDQELLANGESSKKTMSPVAFFNRKESK